MPVPIAAELLARVLSVGGSLADGGCLIRVVAGCIDGIVVRVASVESPPVVITNACGDIAARGVIPIRADRLIGGDRGWCETVDVTRGIDGERDAPAGCAKGSPQVGDVGDAATDDGRAGGGGGQTGRGRADG